MLELIAHRSHQVVVYNVHRYLIVTLNNYNTDNTFRRCNMTENRFVTSLNFALDNLSLFWILVQSCGSLQL